MRIKTAIFIRQHDYKMNSAGHLNVYHKLNQDFVDQLVDVISPYIHEGITTIYKNSYKTAKDKGDENKVIYIFQKILVSVEHWTDVTIEKATENIKIKSGTVDYLERLLQTVIKTEIILMTLNPAAKIDGMDLNQYTLGIKLPGFIHRCYIECAKDAHNYSFLFYDNVSTLEYNRNQLTVNDLFRKAILRAIRKTVPIRAILEQFDKIFQPTIVTIAPDISLSHMNQDLILPPINEVVSKICSPVLSEKKGGQDLNILEKKKSNEVNASERKRDYVSNISDKKVSEISGKGLKEEKHKEVKKILEMSDLMSAHLSEALTNTESIETIKASISEPKSEKRKLEKKQEKKPEKKLEKKKSEEKEEKFHLSVTELPIEEYGETETEKKSSLLV